MKKAVLFLAMTLVSIFAIAQTSHYNQVVWLNGKMMYANPIPAIDSITYTDDATEQDTLFMLMPRTIVRVQHDTVNTIKYDTVYINTCKDDSKKIGTFYVSATKQVAFAPGNLQYTRSTNTWSFAEHQYDYIGEANVRNKALTDTIDLFGWSATNTIALFGISISISNPDYSGNFVDWGTNMIGMSMPNTWRTLTYDEWLYLFQHAHWTIGRVNRTLGLMLLPDGFVAPNGITVNIIGDGNISGDNRYISENEWESNVYTTDAFAQLEALGCVFFPCAGMREEGLESSDPEVNYCDNYGNYWLATPLNTNWARNFEFYSTYIGSGQYNARHLGHSVRLVQDLQ